MDATKQARLDAIRAAKAGGAPAPVAPSGSGRLAAAGELFDEQPSISFVTFLSILLAMGGGALVAVFVLPAWLPGLSDSLLGSEPKAYWYLSRSSAIVSYLMFWLSMVLGLMMTNRLARLWPGGPAAFDLHQHTSLLGLAFALFHALILMGDQWIKATISQILVPFAYSGYQPEWVGVGQVTLYGLAVIALSFYLRPWIGRSGWRAIHFLSFVAFIAALAHGIVSGTDSAAPMITGMYWVTGASVLFLTIYRIMVSTLGTIGAKHSARS